jgi:uncharacterized delta-60 repeat protein
MKNAPSLSSFLLLSVSVWFSVVPAAAEDPAPLPGALDEGFLATGGASARVNAVVQRADGLVVIGGAFTTFNSSSVRQRLVAIDASGALASGFTPPNPNAIVETLALLPEGRLAVGGQFTNLSGRNYAAIVESGGAVVADFNANAAVNDLVLSIAPLGDGAYALAGNFYWEVAGSYRGGIRRVSASGALDTGFTGYLRQGSFEGIGNAVIPLPGGRILIGGAFNNANGVSTGNLVALDATTGAVVQSFSPGASGAVLALAVQPDGKLLVGGQFLNFGGAANNFLVRLNADGTLDATFATAGRPNGAVRTIALDEQGRILIGGDFTLVAGVSRSRLARLLPDGSVDLSFDPGTGANASVRAIALQADGNLLIGGDFTEYDGQSRLRVARVFGGNAPIAEVGYQVWSSTYFLPSEAALAVPEVDADGDGLSNLLEFAFGGNPREASADLAPAVGQAAVASEQHLQIAFQRAAAAAGFVRYEVEASDSLAPEIWTVIWSSDDHPYAGTEAVAAETVTDPQPISQASRRFLRLRVTSLE